MPAHTCCCARLQACSDSCSCASSSAAFASPACALSTVSCSSVASASMLSCAWSSSLRSADLSPVTEASSSAVASQARRSCEATQAEWCGRNAHIFSNSSKAGNVAGRKRTSYSLSSDQSKQVMAGHPAAAGSCVGFCTCCQQLCHSSITAHVCHHMIRRRAPLTL